MATERITELARQHRVMAIVRSVAVPFALVQILTYYRPYPPGMRQAAFAAVVLLAVGTAVVWLGSRSAQGVRASRRWAVAGLVLDALVALALVAVYTFDPDTAVWALLYLIPLEGALLFQLRGALAAFGLVAVGYTVREIYGDLVHGVEFLVVSVTFRMGIGLMMAVVMGLTAEGLVRERDRLRALTDALRRRSEDLESANRALESARRTQAEFMAVANHELRTPLTAIKGFARTLSARWAEMEDDTKRAAVDAIDQQSRRLDELVEDLLTVTAMRAGGLVVDPRPIVLGEWLREAVTVSEVSARIDCRDDVGVVADPTRLVQVMVNLLTNARKYGAPPIVVHARRDRGRVLIEVADHGPGIPEAFVPQMFEEFTQFSTGVNRTAGGYGLGLAIVDHLIRAMSGTITYRKGKPTGAVFSIAMPAADVADHDSGVSPRDPSLAHPARTPARSTPKVGMRRRPPPAAQP